QFPSRIRLKATQKPVIQQAQLDGHLKEIGELLKCIDEMSSDATLQTKSWLRKLKGDKSSNSRNRSATF
ncbi:MAG: hypothetical protein ACE5G1_10130, partial [bacterium]